MDKFMYIFIQMLFLQSACVSISLALFAFLTFSFSSSLRVALPSPPPRRNGRVTKLPEGKAFENYEKNVIPQANYFPMFFGQFLKFAYAFCIQCMSLVAQTAICDLLRQLAERLSKNNFHIILSAEKTVLLKFSKYVPL